MNQAEDNKIEQMSSAQIYWQLFKNIFILSSCTFGEGFVIIGMMKKTFVEKLHWISEEEMLDMTAIAQSAPGALGVNIACHCHRIPYPGNCGSIDRSICGSVPSSYYYFGDFRVL